MLFRRANSKRIRVGDVEKLEMGHSMRSVHRAIKNDNKIEAEAMGMCSCSQGILKLVCWIATLFRQ